MRPKKPFNFAAVLLACCISLSAQIEIITNSEVIQMIRAGLSDDLVIRKIESVGTNFNTTSQNLIELKKAGVSDRIISLMSDKQGSKKPEASKSPVKTPYSDSNNQPIFPPNSSDKPPPKSKPRIVLTKAEALKNAKTIAIRKSSLQPSRQALEKELLKRKEWRDLNLNIVRHKDSADLYLEIGYVSMSWLTHRYVYRIYDRKSGTVILAGETTSWGSLAKNLARGITKRLTKAVASAKQT